MQLVAGGMSDIVEPSPAVETNRVDHQRVVSFPPTNRLAQPRRIGIRAMLRVHQNDAIHVGRALIQDDDTIGQLDHLEWIRSTGVARHARGQAISFAISFGIAPTAFLDTLTPFW